MSDTAGFSKRIYKKKYKQAISKIADKIPLAFKDKKDKKKWISHITNERMREIRPQLLKGDEVE